MKKENSKRFFIFAAIAILLLYGCGTSNDDIGTGKYEHQSGLSTNTELKSIVFSPNFQLFPTFSEETRNKRVYTASVLNNVEEITIKPTIYDRFSTMTVNGVPHESATDSEPIGLVSGENNFIEVEITSESGEARSYQITIYRSSLSMDTSLASLEVSEGVLEPSFNDRPGGDWNVAVPYEVETITVTPEPTHPKASVTVNGRSPASGINLVEGQSTPILIQVTPEETAATPGFYTLIVSRGGYTQSDDVSLNGITFSSATIEESINLTPGVESTATVAYDISSIVITPEEGHSGQTITIGGNDPADPVTLAEGENAIEIHVIAENGSATETYLLTITRALNSDNSLSGLVINSADTFTMSPTFEANGDGPWTVRFASKFGAANFSITPSSADSISAVIRVDNQAVDSGTASQQFTVNDSSQINVPITVTASDGSEAVYQLTAIHPGLNANDNNQLAGLTISPGELSPVFSSTTYAYSAEVPSDTSFVTVTAQEGDSSQTITINGHTSPADIQLTQGSTTITVTTVAENGSSQDTAIIVTRALTHNANLTSIGLSEGTLSPVFNADTVSYTASVSSVSDSIVITPTAENANITGIDVDGNPVASGSPITIPLVTGDNAIPIVVTADDTTTSKTYTVTVNRPEVANTALSSLEVSPGPLVPLFSENNNGPWTVDVAADVAEVAVTTQAADAGATVELQLADGTPITSPVAVAAGTTDITIVVTAGISTQQYVLTINKAAGSGPLLSDITIEMGTTIKSKRQLYANFNTPHMEGDPAAFSPDIKEYAAVVYGFRTITVRATAQTPGDIATLTINGNGTFDSVNGYTEESNVFLMAGAGYVTPVEIIATDNAGNSTTYTVNVKLLNVFEFYRIVYRPPMDLAYDERWIHIRPDGLSDETLPGLISGELRWWTSLGGNGALNQMQLTSYHDGQYGMPYNENGVIVDGLTVGDLKNNGGWIARYDGYVEGDGYDVYTATDTGDMGELIAHLTYQLKVYDKNKITAPDSWIEVEYLGTATQFHFRRPSDDTHTEVDCPVINPADDPGFDWYGSWDERLEAPCFENNFAAKDPNYP